MAEAFLHFLLEKLNSLIQNELGLIWGVDKDMKKLLSLLSTIQDVLVDAEEKQIEDRTLQNWLRKLKDAAYKVDDILDECATEAARLESRDKNSRLFSKVNTLCLSYLHPHNILYCRKIGNRMRDISERLDEIAEERLKFHLREGVTEKRVEVAENRQTGSIIIQCKVYGRNEDKERIVECLVKQVADSDDISVYPIVGLGGLGKTTLAQMVFNDKMVMRHFEIRVWVCISEYFNVRRITKAIIESATETTCEALDLEPLQRRLQGILREKRYLLVLDDVWNEDQENWDRLKHVLACGSKGASIIVTTRTKKVALIMGTLPLHHLSGLIEDDCWSLFMERAFGSENEERPNLVTLGKKIVKKCGGVPLAVKSLGSLMRYKREENEWRSVVESELWNLSLPENSIFPALQLSYKNLPSKLRQCFAYCAIFPKNFLIKKEDLIQLWMANDFIPSAGKLEPEDVGNDFCNELCWRSFFQDVEKDKFGNIKRFRMHDLVHDLAQSIMNDECHIIAAESSDNISNRICHVTVGTDQLLNSIPKLVNETETLRTFLVQPGPSQRSFEASMFCGHLSRLSSLRVFSARRTTLTKLSSSISRLSHLRYLDLSLTCIQKLPESICSLINLQTLKLVGCVLLRELPKHMKRLKNLRHLYLNNCFSLSHTPPGIGQITCLKTLTLFVVGKKRGCHLAELKALDLGGELRIKHLNRVDNPIDAKEANLVGKQNLRSLYLSWRHDGELEPQEDVEKILEALEPHPNLEHLVIEEYKGVEFPIWMGDQILKNVVSITLSKCMNCSQLPSLGQLPSLQYLEIHGMIHLLYIDQSIMGGGMMIGFPSLKELIIRDLPSLQRLSREDSSESFSRLTDLRITNCPRLSLPCLPSVTNLSVRGCNELLLRSISNLRALIDLNISGNDDSIYVPHGMLQSLTSLHRLSIRNFSKLKVLPAEIVSLKALNSLLISDCHEFESFPEEGLEGLNSLQLLQLNNCRKFTSLSEGLHHLSKLENLILNGCPDLVALPDGIKHLSSLQQLTISGRFTGIDASKLSNPAGLYNLVVMTNTGEPVTCPRLAILPEAVRFIPALQSLRISCFENLASLPYWLGDLTSLQSLQIFDCLKLSYLPASIQSLTKLQKLAISQCPELQKQCEKETGDDWYKIAHVPNVYVDH